MIAELEKLGPRYRIALSQVKDASVFTRVACAHTGVYADDCLVQRVTAHKCFIVGTNDRELKRRIRKIPGVPLMSATRKGMAIER